MTNETKFNIGDKVWVLTDNHIATDVIEESRVEITNSHVLIYHKIRGCKYFFKDDDLFRTKQELLDSL